MMDRLLENDTVLKILSVLVAVFIWFTVNFHPGGPQLERRLGPVPISWSVPSRRDLTVLSIRPASVTIFIQGSPSVVGGAATAGAWVNLASITAPGTYTLHVEAAVPTGSSLVQVVPRDVVVTVDVVVTRHFHPVLTPVGTPADGYGLVRIGGTERAVAVTGPSRYVKMVRAVVGRVGVSGETTNFQAQVILQPVNARGVPVSHVQVSPEVLDVPVKILPEKTVPVVVRYAGHPATGLTVTGIQVSPGRVTVAGPAAALAGLSAIDTVPVNVGGARHDVTAEAALSLPAGLQVVAPARTVEVTIAIGS
jgi:YbbR domain-containing protein